MFNSSKEVVESAEQIFADDDELVFVFSESQKIEDASGRTVSGTTLQRSRDEFELWRDGSFDLSNWSGVEKEASYFAANSGYEELETVADVMELVV